MRVKLPRLSAFRARYFPPARAPILRYGVAILSVILALIPALLLSDLVESRLVVFAVAIMVSAWYGGWKPGLVATSFALTVSAYFSLAAGRTEAEYRKAIIHLILFVFVAVLICSFNAALRAAQEALLRSEINFRSLVTNAPYGICRCDSAGILLSMNPAMVSLLGYASQSELTGRNLASLYTDSQGWFAVADSLRNEERFNNFVADWMRKDGSSVMVRLSGRTIRDPHNTTFFEFFAEDVTERRALELQLRQAQKMEAIGRLAGGIAHDFNNLLMVISGYSEFLLERIGPNPAVRGPAQEISNAATRATSLTRQLLAFSRQQMLTPKVFDLNAVVTESSRMLDRLIGEDIDLVILPDTDLGMVKADPGQIEQVIMNLAVNARDAMPKGGELKIETANVSLDNSYARLHAPVEPGNYVMLAISDTGAGMDAELQSHIFEPFFSTKGPKGTGLGLSTVYGIIKQSGGYIWVDSEPGKGTTFKVYLPRVDEAAQSTLPEAALSPQKTVRGHETILVVEDEDTVLRLAREYLQMQGYNLLEAADGEAALQLSAAHKGPIHLLLTDIIMPGITGRELANQLSRTRPEMKVLYMSGYTENVVGHNGLLDSGVVLLQKPFSLPTLRAKVREVLDTATPPEVLVSAQSAQAQPVTMRNSISASRAQRFKLQLPLKYRPLGQAGWLAGTTENISRSGLLFRAEETIAPNVQLEISLVLPAEIAGLSDAEVLCRGEVVRAIDAEGPTLHPALAAKILQYHFQHGSQIPEA
jgi:PAS domain S-box-containing protein